MKKQLLIGLLLLLSPVFAAVPSKYAANVIAVYDGDTITVDIYLGLGIWIKGKKIRLLGINAPEIIAKNAAEKQKGYQARAPLRTLLLGKAILLETQHDKVGKYGRLLATVYLRIHADSLLNVNRWMSKHGFAVVKDY